jgi:hypothetical protein
MQTPHTVAGQDTSAPIYGLMKVIQTGETCELVSHSPEGIFKLKMKDGTVRKYNRKELDIVD